MKSLGLKIVVFLVVMQLVDCFRLEISVGRHESGQAAMTGAMLQNNTPVSVSPYRSSFNLRSGNVSRAERETGEEVGGGGSGSVKGEVGDGGDSVHSEVPLPEKVRTKLLMPTTEDQTEQTSTSFEDMMSTDIPAKKIHPWERVLQTVSPLNGKFNSISQQSSYNGRIFSIHPSSIETDSLYVLYHILHGVHYVTSLCHTSLIHLYLYIYSLTVILIKLRMHYNFH